MAECDGELTSQEGAELVARDIRVRLSGEQVAVMQAIARGLTYVEIGAELGMSCGTVYNRVLAVRNALGARNRTEALCLLLHCGVVR
jgi:DNA-binding NarL/FixJ family response regulator